MAKSPVAKSTPAPEKPLAEPTKPAGNRRYRVKEMAFIDGHRFRAGAVIVLPDGQTMKALEPLESVDEPSSIPARPPIQTFPGATPFPKTQDLPGA